MTVLSLSNRYLVDAEGRLHPMTWGDVILELLCKTLGAAALGYFILMVII
jgi:hypothetical protein